jgi:hypothetical protein
MQPASQPWPSRSPAQSGEPNRNGNGVRPQEPPVGRVERPLKDHTEERSVRGGAWFVVAGCRPAEADGECRAGAHGHPAARRLAPFRPAPMFPKNPGVARALRLGYPSPTRKTAKRATCTFSPVFAASSARSSPIVLPS